MTRPATMLAVGTSPLMMMHALAHARAGWRVTVLDRTDVVGGSWSTPAMLGLSQVECGVHLLENRPEFHASLQGLGVALERDDRCFSLWRGRRSGMRGSRALFHTLVALKAARAGRLDSFRRISRSALLSARHSATPFHYPRQGCREINGRLVQLLEAAGAEIRLRTAIEAIHVERGGGVVCATAAQSFEAERILIGSRAHAPIHIDGMAQAIPMESSGTLTILLRWSGGCPPGYSYVEILGDRLLKRVRDITAFALPLLPDGQFLLAAQLRDTNAGALSAPGVAEIITQLRKLQLLPADARIAEWDCAAYPLQTIGDRDLMELAARSAGRIVAVRTTDLADGFQAAPIPS